VPSYSFHHGAAEEYLAATKYYLATSSPLIAAAYVSELEAAIDTLLGSPETWPIIAYPQIRRFLLKRFPYSIYYQFEIEDDRITIYAVMHHSRLPDYWRNRLD